MKVTIKDDFMQRIATEEAWKSLSEDFAWTEALLEKVFVNRIISITCILNGRKVIA